MLSGYLWLNAVLYLGFAGWCTLRHGQTSRAGGYITLDNSGHSEYLVIYGGLQFGLAAFFAYVAAAEPLHRAGLIFALCLYSPIVLYRLVTVFGFHPVNAVTLATAGLETLLLAGALVVFLRR